MRCTTRSLKSVPNRPAHLPSQYNKCNAVVGCSTCARPRTGCTTRSSPQPRDLPNKCTAPRAKQHGGRRQPAHIFVSSMRPSKNLVPPLPRTTHRAGSGLCIPRTGILVCLVRAHCHLSNVAGSLTTVAFVPFHTRRRPFGPRPQGLHFRPPNSVRPGYGIPIS